jgi:hypothetical protein
MEDNTKMDLQEIGCEDVDGSLQLRIWFSDRLLGSKGREFFNYLSNY